MQVNTLSADYATHQVTFSVSWAAGTRNATHLSKVWVFIDFAPVITDNSLGVWQRADLTAPTPTAGTISGLTGKGFFLEGTPGAFSATVTVTLTGVPAKYSWCAYATDYPPVATMKGNTFELTGTPPFVINGTYTEPSFTYTGGLVTSLTDKTGCPGIVIADPVVTTTSPAAVCAGSAVTLTATASGGTTTAMTYTWHIGGAQTTTTVNTYTVPAASVTANTTYSVSVTNAYNTTSDPASGTITVHTVPTFSIAASPTTVCKGSSTTLTITATGAASYSFNNGSTWQAGNTYSVSPTGNITYNAKIRTADGCASNNSETVTVAVNSPATNGQTATACGCASGLTNCSGTCKSGGTYTTNDGACFAVGKAYKRVRNVCGAVTNSAYGSYTNTSCKDWTSCGISEVSTVASEGTMNWSTANTFCQNKGMRLPTSAELGCMCSTRYSLPGGYNYLYYWSSSPRGSSYYAVFFTSSNCTTDYGSPSGNEYVKCVK